MSAAPYTLADLLAGQSRNTLQARFLALLGTDQNPPPAPVNSNHGFPVADWLSNPAGMEMAFVRMVKDGIFDLIAAALPAKIAGRFLAKGTGDFLSINTDRFYAVDRNGPTSTTFNLDVTSTSSADPQTFAPGDIWVQGASGLRYVSTTGGSLPSGGTITISFEAEFPGSAYNDNPTLKLNPPTLVTAFAGVTVAASAGVFTTPVQSGFGTGHFNFAGSDGLPVPGLYVFRVDISGDPGTASFSLSKDNAPFVSVGTLFPVPVLDQYSMIAAPIIGAGTPASFLAGDTYTTSAPGGTGYVQGNDQETDPSLVQRARARWPSLSLNQTNDVLVLWTKTAYPPANRVTVRADPQAQGGVQIVAADSHGGIDPTQATVINAYINQHLGDVLAKATVSAAANLVAVTAGTVTVTALTVGAIQNAISIAWPAYLATVPIGGVVLLSQLEKLIMDAGAMDVQGLTLNGVAANLVAGNNQVAIAGSILTELAWAYS